MNTYFTVTSVKIVKMVQITWGVLVNTYSASVGTARMVQTTLDVLMNTWVPVTSLSVRTVMMVQTN